MTMILSCLLVAALAQQGEVALYEPQGEVALRAGQDVPTPKRIHYVEAKYPDLARAAGVAGVVLLEIGVEGDGLPHAIRVLEDQPLLRRAAIDAARRWRYEPTVVEGRARRVALREMVEVFPDRDAATRYFADLVKSDRQRSPMRILAAQRLVAGGDFGTSVLAALEHAAKDKDREVATAAAEALRALQEKAAGSPR